MKQTLLILLLLFFPSMLLADEPGLIVRLSKVYNDANIGSGLVASIEAGSTVNVMERKGGWKLIFSDEKSIIGWVRSYQVRTGYTGKTTSAKAETDSRGFFSGLVNLSRKASGFFGGGNNASNTSNSSVTATIGVRGLSEAEIKSAKPDPVELKKMHSFASSAARMPGFTSQGKLQAQQVTANE